MNFSKSVNDMIITVFTPSFKYPVEQHQEVFSPNSPVVIWQNMYF